jgi:predicted hydrocarbon binding protein
MLEDNDFERAWLAKFSHGLEEIAGERIRKIVMEGSDDLSDRSNPQEAVAWSKQAMERLESLVDEGGRRAVMTGCSCQYPKSDLQAIRKAYETTGDVDLAHRMLQEKFESFLKQSLELREEIIEEIVGRGWGVAGVKKGNTIIATKIPKSGYLVEYMQEIDGEKKRQTYCHCPRVRESLRSSETISELYCYCGAGYYQGIWEEILQEPVEIEVLSSVLGGDEVCTIAIHLPLAY